MSDDCNPVVLATQLTAAWLSNANTRADPEKIPDVLRSLYAAITGLASGRDAVAQDQTPGSNDEISYLPAVSVRKSLARSDVILSLIDGKPYKTLRRHLNKHGLTPEEYRRRYNLKPDYPMVAPEYSALRSETSKRLNVGYKSKEEREAMTLALAPPSEAPLAVPPPSPAPSPVRAKTEGGTPPRRRSLKLAQPSMA